MRLPILALIAAGTFTGVSLASAQAVFVTGTAGVGVHQFDDESGMNRLDGVTPAFSVAGGVLLRTFIVQAEASFDLNVRSEQTLPLSVNGQVLTIRSTLDHTINSVSLLGGYMFDLSSAVSLRALGGIATAGITRTFTTNAPILVLTAPSTRPPLVTETADRFASWNLGADVILRRTPGVRVIAGLRWDPLHLEPDLDGRRVRVLAGLTWTSR